MAITDFFADPDVVSPNEILTLNSFFDDDCETVIYELPEESTITFVDGLRKIKSSISDMSDSTPTTLEGNPGDVIICAYCENKPDNKKKWLVELLML